MAVVVIGALAPTSVALAWLVARSVPSPLQADRPASSLVVPVGSASRDFAVPVKVALVPGTPRQVRLTGPGVVTGIDVRVGQRLMPGMPVLRVDDRIRLAFTGEAPLWRDIGAGMKGADVTRAQAFLSTLGFSAGATPGTVTSSTLAGIRSLNRRLGVEMNTSVLHRDSLVWIGPQPLTVGEVAVHVGDTTADGQVVVKGPAAPASVTVTEPPASRPATGPWVLAVGEATVPYPTGAGRVTQPAAVAAVAKALHGTADGAGFLRLAKPVEVATMPVSAIVTDGDGRTCVFTDATGPPTMVRPIGGTMSIADVPIEWTGRPVLVNPRDVRQDLSCG